MLAGVNALAKVGDRVLFGKYTGSEVKVDVGEHLVISPSSGFSFAVSGMMMPPEVFSSSFTRRIITHSERAWPRSCYL